MFGIVRLLTLFVQIGLAVGLARWLGPGVGLAIFAITALALSLVAGLLLKKAPSGSTSWRNLVAGLLLPWASFFGPGSLLELILKNALAAIAIAVFAVGCDWLNIFEPEKNAEAHNSTLQSVGMTVLNLLTAAGWLVLLAGWALICKSQLQNRSEPISVLLLRRNRILPLLVPPVVVGISVACRVWQWYWLSFFTVWGPLVLVFLPVILMLISIFILTLQGKPIRWN